MTTIVIDGTTQSVYTDSQATCTNTTTNAEYYLDNTVKATYVTNEHNEVIAGSGNHDLNQTCRVMSHDVGHLVLPRYTKDQSDTTIAHVVKVSDDVLQVNIYKPTVKSSNWLVTFFTGKYDKWKQDSLTDLGEGQVITFGSGSHYAYGSIKTQQQANKDGVVDIDLVFKVTSECDTYTNNKVQSYPLS